MVKVKICGVTREEDLCAAVQAGADAVGFVVGVNESPRNLSLGETRKLIRRLPKNVDSVAVTIFNGLERIVEISQKLAPSFMQLHGMAPSVVGMVKQAADTKIILAVDSRAPVTPDNLVTHSASIDALLVDTCGPGGLGGTGCTHDWSLSRKIRDAIYPVPMILAGGLTPENVSHAIRAVRPYGVDVSTGVEARPGVKDPVKISEFVRKAKEVQI
mgnify:CR=1 FL=1